MQLRRSLQQLARSRTCGGKVTSSVRRWCVGDALTLVCVQPKKSAKYACLFGGKSFIIGPRITPLPDSLKNDSIYQGDDSGAAILEKQLAAEKDQAIHLILWELCLRHPEVRDVCDLGQMLLWNKRWAWWATAVMFVLNNTFVQGIHVLVGAQYINTMTEFDSIGGCRTVQFALVVTIAGWLVSLPRTFDVLSRLGAASAFFAFISVFLATIFAGIQGKPPGYDLLTKGEPTVKAWPVHSTTFVQCVSASLAMSFTFFGQITLPSFIAEMRDPREFPKSLWACTVAETITFSIVGVVIYAYTGDQYIVPLAFGSLHDLYKKISFSFLMPTVLFLGCLYASVTTRFIFFRLFRDTRHTKDHTLVGWASWAGILLTIWITAFIISQVIPFFSSLLSVISSLFNSWFGLIFWGIAFFRMRHADHIIGRFRSPMSDYLLQAINVFIIAVGLFYLGAGTYASVEGILDEFEAGTVRGVFQCKSDGL
ncbi:transmembrane amino acid transporter protein [Hirsutella rhossiliensis]|uniref:Transmembrane amino acid transporter protein n=1 Tax=Hirsutella rhossiliensis TaxID=111463 RepID=A0A9P8MPZ8_9HYPO|nr:transmembrane amino acid transporter protein [Hirsutella rhossiliensis]KAH0958379.1 transmembrane amino acid transporter protein [Hirsutella rhossiliensis]